MPWPRALSKVICPPLCPRGRVWGRQSRLERLAAVAPPVGAPLFDAVTTNTRLDATRPPYWHSDVVAAEWRAAHRPTVIAADVVDEANAVRHDAAKLACAIIRAWAHHARGRRF